MRKKLLTFLCAIAASIGPIFANGTKIGDLYYVFDDTDQTAWVTWQTLYYSYDYEWDNYRGLSDVVIPSSIEYNNTAYTVVGIGGAAFGTSSIKSVTIPSTVTTIDNDAFYDCWNLKSLNIPNSVTSIGAEAFESCSGLTSIDIPNSVTSIGESAFQGCSGLTSPVYNAHIFAYMPTSYSGAYTIPDGIESIVSGAFSYCRSLTSVTIPNSVTSIGDRAFSYCSGLTSPVCNAHIFAYMPEAYSGEYAIPDGIETIAGSAFSLCESLSSVTIPESVTNIGNKAFYGCSSLTSVTIPSNVTSIGEDAFGNCSGLISITCKATTPPSLGYGVFYNVDTSIPLFVPEGCVEAYQTAQYWNKFKNIYTIKINIDKVEIDGLYYNLDCHTLTAEVTSQNAEYWDAQITNAEIPSSVSSESITYSVTSIGYRAFYGCSSMLSVTIPSSVTSIGREAFYGCSSLASVIIPNSVTSIGDYAFNDCSGLTSLTIGDFAFKLQNGNWALVKYTGHEQIVQLPDATIFGNTYYIEDSAFPHNEEMTSVIIPNGVTSISVFAFYECVNLISVTIPNSVTSIGFDQFGQGAFVDCSINEIHFTGTIDEWLAKSWLPISISQSYSLYVGDAKIEECVLPNSVTSIGGSAFSGCSSLTSVTIPNSVTSIGEWAFSGCSGLTSVTIPNSVTSIGNYAFKGCSSLTSVTIPNSVTSIGSSAFSGCSGLTSVTIGNSVTSIGELAFYNCTGLTSVTIPNSVTSIGSSAFSGCSGLTSVTIPNSVTSIGSSAFSGCSGLTSVTLNSNAIVSQEYSKNISIGNLFGPQVKEYIIGEDVTSIGNYAFYNRTGLTSVTIGNSVTSIGEGAFYYCSGLTSVTIPNSVTSIGIYAFKWCRSLTSVTIGNSVTSIGSEAFNGCSSLTAIYVPCGEMERFKQMLNNDSRINDHAPLPYTITINATNGNVAYPQTICDDMLLNATPDYGYHFVKWSDGVTDNPRTIELTQDTTFTAEFAYDRVGTCGKDLALVWSYDPNSKVLTIGNAGEFTENMQFGAEAPAEMEELVIGNNVTAIGENAFAGISTLKKVTIGESVKTIQNNAFYNCVNLETIFNYRPTPTNAYSTAFDGVDKFECILYVLPNSIDMYKNASVWRDFYYTYAIGAEETTVTTNDVQVEPQDNAATLTWPTSNNAVSYTIEITKDGVVFCRLTFNANGQLTGIAFAPGRDGQSMAPAAVMTANGLQFTVTGLDSNTQYGYNVTAKDANERPIATYSGSFTTTSEGVATGIGNTAVEQKITKILHNGEVLILRDGKTYSIQGVEVK